MGAFYIHTSQKEIADSEEKRLLELLDSIKEALTESQTTTSSGGLLHPIRVWY